jgi:hypothetical protein
MSYERPFKHNDKLDFSPCIFRMFTALNLGFYLSKFERQGVQECLTHASLILLRGAQTLTFLYTVSILQPSPHTNRQGSGTLFVQFVSFVDGEKVYVA